MGATSETETAVRSLTILDFGRSRTDLGKVLAPGDLDGRWEIIAFPGYLIELNDGRRVLVDTGPNRRHIHEPMYEYAGSDFANALMPVMTDADDPVNRLAEVGLTPADIDVLIVTHHHFDHAGNTADFVNSEIVVHRDSHAEGIARGKAGQPGGLPETGKNGEPLHYRLVDGDEELAPGLSLLHTPGHANGHMSVLLRLPETGTVILAIDAIYSSVNRELANYRVGVDPMMVERSARRLIELSERENAMLIYGHDWMQWAELRKAPERYT